MRLSKEDFLELIADPLVRGVTYREAAYLQSKGFALVDTRDPVEFRQGTLRGATNVPVHLIRTHVRDLSKDENYIICHNDPVRARLGAFLFLERGLDANYLEEPADPYIRLRDPQQSSRDASTRTTPTPTNDAETAKHAETTTMTNANNSNGAGSTNGSSQTANPHDDSSRSDRVPREDFTDTVTGLELADIIDELDREREEIESSNALSLGGELGPSSEPQIETEGND